MATLWLFGVLACVGLPRQAGGFGLAGGNDRGEGLISPSMEGDSNGGQGSAWDDDAGMRSTKKSPGLWIPGVSQPWILISAALGGLCLVLAPIWLAVRFVRAKRARRAGVGGRPRRAGKAALAANLVQTQLNRGRFAETVVAEENTARRAA
jgi:hypothetical protein